MHAFFQQLNASVKEGVKDVMVLITDAFFCEARVCVWNLAHPPTLERFGDVGKECAATATDSEGRYSMIIACGLVVGKDGQGLGFPGARFAYPDFTTDFIFVLDDFRCVGRRVQYV